MVDVQDEYQTAGSKDFQLFQNYPNPFNPETKIRYRLSQTEHVNISVYDLLGAKIAELLDETSGTGEHSITLNGSGLASGTYLLRMSTGNSSQSLKIVLLK
jgi:hypothetical protein